MTTRRSPAASASSSLIARALAQGAPFLVMDEPTASLDFGNQAMVLARIRDLAADGYGIVLSTHDPDHALLVGDPRRHHRRGRRASDRQARRRRHRQDAVGALPHRSVVEETPSGRRVCVPVWQRVREPGQASGLVGD